MHANEIPAFPVAASELDAMSMSGGERTRYLLATQRFRFDLRRASENGDASAASLHLQHFRHWALL